MQGKADMQSFENRNAVITGAGSGVGAALAAALDAEGANLMLLDRDEAGIAHVAEALGGRPMTATVDVTDTTAVRRAADTAFEAWGNVHLLCSNAGIMPPVLPLWELAEADLAQLLNVNVAAFHNVVRAFVPRLRAQQDRAHVVVTASEAAFESRAFVTAYHASKHAVLALAEGLAQELRFDDATVRVSVLCPSAINTHLMDDHDVSRQGSSGQRLAAVYQKSLERGHGPEAVAQCVVEGVKAGRYYLLPHPEVAELPQRRADAVREDTYPEMPEGLARLITPQP